MAADQPPGTDPQSQRVALAVNGLVRRIGSVPQVTVGSVVGPLMHPYRHHLAVALALNALHGIAITCQNVTPKWLIDDVLLVADVGPYDKLRNAALLALAYVLFSAFGRMLVWHLGYRIFTWVRERMVFTLRCFFFRHVNHLCLRFHGQHPSGELFSYLFGSPLGQVVNFYQQVSVHGAGAIFTLISTIILVGAWDPVLLGVLLATALASVLVMGQAKRKLHALHKEYQETERNVVGHVADVLRGSKAVKIYAMEEQIEEDFRRDAGLIGRKQYELAIKGHVQNMKQETVNYLAYGLLIVVCAWRYVQGEAAPGEAAAVLNSFSGITSCISFFFTSTTQWAAAQASIERIGTVLKTASTTPDPQGDPTVAPPAGALRFDHVRFRYADDQPWILDDFSLEIPYGQRIAFVGPSGAGKSTIIQLALRLYDPQEGAVTIAGTDLRRIAGADLRRRFGVVPQDPFIFRASIRDNLRVADPDADDAAMERACRRANAWEFVRDLPQGLDTVVGEGGSTLSGGQRQRLAIARALLANPPFFVFDEATSALDTRSEQCIQQTLEQELGAATSIFIAHRLATVKNCHRIVVVAGGRIVQDGAYGELISRPGMFRSMVEGQNLLE